MWPIPALEKELCIVSFSTHAIGCSWIQKADDSSSLLVMRAYKHYELDDLELEKGILFNPTRVKKYVNSFLEEYNKKNAFVVFSVKGPCVTEEIVTLPTSTPQKSDFNIAQSSNSLWGYRYLYPDDHGRFVFYVYGVPRLLILQYQLLAIALQINLLTITTQSVGQLSAYQHIFGSAFRRSQLALDMERHNTIIDKLVSAESLKRIIRGISSIALDTHVSNIAAACGLFFEERIDI